MEVLNSDNLISDIQEASKFSGTNLLTCIWVLHADKIPPHVGMSSKGFYFSTKANGSDSKLPVASVIDIINKKKITALCIELSYSKSVNELETGFNEYAKTIPGKVTCLNPIKDVLGIQSPQKLTELLSELYASHSVNAVYGFNVDADSIEIKAYTVDDIHARLKNLSNG